MLAWVVPDTDDKDDDVVVLGAVDGVESVPNTDYDALVLGTVAAEIDDKKMQIMTQPMITWLMMKMMLLMDG